MDSIYVINLVCIPDTLNAHVSNILSTLKIDGIVAVSDTSYDSQLNSLLSLGNNIAEYGVGFSDVVSTILFPLIIAIFALVQLYFHTHNLQASRNDAESYDFQNGWLGFVPNVKSCLFRTSEFIRV